jgi:GR25 family glycosyltransferase involved in LPS biosynthesis
MRATSLSDRVQMLSWKPRACSFTSGALLVFLCFRSADGILTAPARVADVKPKGARNLMPVYYISMDKSTMRRNMMMRQLEYFDTTATHVVASDFKRTTDCLRTKTCQLPYGAKVWHGENDHLENWERQLKQIYSHAEVGCTISHLKAIGRAYDDGVQHALILEDDADLLHVKYLDEPLDKLVAQAPNDWQILQLWSNNPQFYQNHSYFDRKCEDRPPVFVPWRDDHWSTMAYIINRDGMSKILSSSKFSRKSIESAISVSIPAPVVADHMLYNVARTYTLTQPLVRHQDFLDSSIQQASEDVVSETDARVNEIVDAFYMQRLPSKCIKKHL